MKAFPRQITFNNGISEGKWIDDGMDLRDYFAAKAMQSFIHSFSYRKEDENSVVVPDNICNHAYVIADLMMKAREVK
jgi:hypothetical protein